MTKTENRKSTARCIAVLTVLLSAACHTFAADNIRIAPIEDRTTAFAGEDFSVTMRIVADEVPAGTMRWSHSADQRTITEGEVEVCGGAMSATAGFVLRTPAVRDGVIFATTITTEFVPSDSNQRPVSLRRVLTLFPKNPLADRSKWAKELDIELFDPAENTTKVFNDSQLPYRAVRNTAALNAPEQTGILIIGEGNSLVKHRSLAATAINAAAAGRRVIMLAPSEGTFPLPGSDFERLPNGNDNFPGEVRFAGPQVISQLDKRFDARSWGRTTDVIPSSLLRIQSYRGRVEAKITDARPGWPWLEVRFPENGGILIVCGFQVIKHWDNGPTPRFLLVRILETLSEQ